MNISFVLPGIKIIHFKGLRKIGESKIGAYKWLAHYNRNRRCIGRTIKTTFNEPNHYDRRNVPVGYSRKRGWRTYLHFDRSGKPVGYSKRLLGIVWIHHPVNKKKRTGYSDLFSIYR